MYENGRKVSRYYRMREHKRKTKDRFLKNYHYGRMINMSYDQYLATRDEDDLNYCYGCYNDKPRCECYWQYVYLSGPRTFAKDCTSSTIRNYWRTKLNTFDYDNYEDAWEESDFGIGQHSGYQKVFDYNWTVW